MRSGFGILASVALIAVSCPAAGADAPLDVDPANPPAGYESPHCTPTPGAGAYPAEARQKHEEGDGVVRYVVDTDGRVRDAEIVTSTGFPLLDNAALDLVRAFRCTPGTLNGKPVAVRLPFDEHWSLTAIAPEPPGPHAYDSGVTAPVALSPHTTTQDDYPPLARARQEEGKTLVFYVVNADGSVGEARVEKTSGFADLDAASIEMVKHWRFKPATKDGKPLAVSNRAYISWKLTPSLDSLPYFTTMHMGAGDYPASARAAQEEGTALVMVLVDKDGNILETRLEKRTGFADLDTASETLANTRWHYTPAAIDGKPASAAIGIVVVWSLAPAKDDSAKTKE